MFENVCQNEIYDKTFLNENCPEDKAEDLDYIMGLLDWEKNVDPHYRKTYFRPPVVCFETEEYTEKWVAYGNGYIAAKELTVQPGKTVTVQDDTAYGCILTQGYGKIGRRNCSTAGMLRFGQISEDEFFVSCAAAQKGVVIQNCSTSEPLVLLKHFPSDEHTPKAPR